MTPEEMAAKLAELEETNKKYADLASKYEALDAKVNPPQADPDEAYKPKTWKDLDEKVDAKAEAIALKVLQDAEKKKEQARIEQEKLLAENQKQIDDAFAKLEEDGIIQPSKEQGDAGWSQRKQILGSLHKSGGINVREEAEKIKSLWDQGLEYDYESNSIRRQGYTASPTRNAPVASSATQVAPVVSGNVDIRGTKGDLDEIQRRYEVKFGKA